RPEHGYCLDDVARGLIVTVRQPDRTAEMDALARTYLRFIADSQAPDGQTHNRRSLDRRWLDTPSTEDCWGRALWALGVTVAEEPALAAEALARFELSASRRSPWTRAMAFAGLGAAEVLRTQPGHRQARALLAAAADAISPPDRHSNPAWPWPEPRLTYANAALPEVLIAAGQLLSQPPRLTEGLDLLGWLLEIETNEGHVSPTPVGGWSAGEPRPGFDQQPIEVAALAEACARAYAVTDDACWRAAVLRCAQWFLGDNDSATPLWDPVSGGGCDGLEADGRNENQGAESTLALMSSFQQAHLLRPLVRRTPTVLRADPARVIARLFLPGQETQSHGISRADAVIARVLAMSELEVGQTLSQIMTDFDERHPDLSAIFDAHAARVAHRLPPGAPVADQQRRLIGAYFTQEYAIEAAALFNPSLVAHPDQSGAGPGELRVIMSVRAVGEGHISSVEFRTGTLSPDGAHQAVTLSFDEPGRRLSTGEAQPAALSREFVRRALTERVDADRAEHLLSLLPSRFSAEDLQGALASVLRDSLTRGSSDAVLSQIRRIAACNYELQFDPARRLSERVLFPFAPDESHGIEDARFTAFTDAAGDTEYWATYTAFDGAEVAPHLLRTTDFVRFESVQLIGPAAKNKGMALFPRQVGGQYLALSRWDRESIAIARSADGAWWGDAVTVKVPEQAWELIQLGNCGPPIETEAGWLVLTHGVGPMRQYSIGAILLDLADPSVLIAALDGPLLSPSADERDGYVPNVVYSCGALRHGQTLVLPYGCSDSSIRVAMVDLDQLLARLLGDLSELTELRCE
ncbi:MAG: glycosidase related protein, partial [Frankiales bacterium]|nr:glycosidase related protein [Frankiales bacterium]